MTPRQIHEKHTGLGVEITPAMLTAGFDVLCLFDPEAGDAEETAIEVYRAMEAARRSGL